MSEQKCRFYKEFAGDKSRIGKMENPPKSGKYDVYCVVENCACYQKDGTALQFDETPTYMRKCSSKGEVEGGIPVDRHGKQIGDLEKIPGVKGLISSI